MHYMTLDVMMVIYCCSFEPPKNMADGTVVSDGLNADLCSDKKYSRDRVDIVREEYKRYKRKDMKAERRKANQSKRNESDDACPLDKVKKTVDNLLKPTFLCLSDTFSWLNCMSVYTQPMQRLLTWATL